MVGNIVMKILIVGCGSMGRRRIRLISELVSEAKFICVDSNPQRLKSIRRVGIEAYADLEDGIGQCPDVAFVCTSPGKHADIILRLISAGINVFTELNLTSDHYDRIIKEANEKGVSVFMSSTMLYKRQIEIVGELVKKHDKPLTYIYHVGQYLPDWHPWENYRDFFAGKKETNGVREILAIQLPWIIETFGSVKRLSVQRNKCTELAIDFDDSVIVSFFHETGNMGVLVADVVSRKAVTKLEVVGENIHIRWDGHNDDLFKLDISSGKWEQIPVYESEIHRQGYSDNIAENPYLDEIKDFLSMIDGGTSPKYSLAKDAYVLSVIDEIEEIKQ